MGNINLIPKFEWQTRIPTKEDHKGLNLPKGVRIKDWREYKVSKEFTPDLYKLQQRLAEKGLKDPWIRNEVWRFDNRVWGTKWQKFRGVFRGLGCGFLAATTMIILDKFIYGEDPYHHHDPYLLLSEKDKKDEHHHHHHHH